jgi:hypothetical protein
MQIRHFPVVDGVQDALLSWQANNLSITGRRVLINAVLSSKLIYFMSLFQLPKWIIEVIDNIRRRFLWH